MLAALEASLGIVSTASKTAGITRKTHYKWMENDPVYAADVASILDISLDFAESRLFQNIKDGDTTAIIFYLKYRGHKRGYFERSHVDMNHSGDIKTDNTLKIVVIDPSKEKPKAGGNV